MAEESFLLVSLEEDKAKHLAQVLSNDTARKILDHLAKKNLSTESEIAKTMKLPLSTVHYNLQLLVKSNLVNDDHYTYSEKGKQVNHYSLSNKYVVIAPKKTDVLIEKLRQFLPVMLVTTGAALAIKYLWVPASPALEASIFDEKVAGSADMALRAVVPAEPVLSSQQFALWFLLGSMVTLLLYFIWAEVILKRKKQ